MLDFLQDASAFGVSERKKGTGAVQLTWSQFVNNHYGALDGTETSLWARLSPAIANVVKVYSRLLKTAPLTLVKPDGEVLRWPPQDGRSMKSRAYQVLRLWEEEPNEIHTPAQFRGMVAEDWIYHGDVIIPQHRRADRTVRRMYVIPSAVVNINSFDNQFNFEYKSGVTYNYYGVSKKLNTKVPQFIHLRNNVDTYWPLRGRPSYIDMPNEVAANAIASIYRKEIFRQGGPVRQVLDTDPESDIYQSVTEQQLQRIADKVAGSIKRMDAWANSITAIPPGFRLQDWGPKTQDETYTNASRLTDEKLAAVHGVPLMYLGNMEKSNYTNARQQIAVLVKDAGGGFFSEIEQMIERVQLRPLGGKEAEIRARFDLDHLMKAEIAIWNKLVLDRLNAGVISVNESREALDYAPMEGKQYDKPRDPMKNAPQQKAPAGDAKGVAKPAADKDPAKVK